MFPYGDFTRLKQKENKNFIISTKKEPDESGSNLITIYLWFKHHLELLRRQVLGHQESHDPL